MLDDFTPLMDLSKHVYHGRVWVNGNEAAAGLDAAFQASDGALIWHGWLNDRSTTYEITFSATSKPEIMKIVAAIKEKVGHTAQFHWCYKKSGQTINHCDWMTV